MGFLDSFATLFKPRKRPSPPRPVVPGPPVPSPPLPGKPVPAGNPDDFAAELLRLHNAARANHSPTLPPLAFHPVLLRAAQGQAAWCASVDRLSHVGPDGSDPFARLKAAGWWGDCSENAASGWPDTPPSFPGDSYGPVDAMTGWRNSPLHWQNIMGQWTHFGAGMATAPSGRRYVIATFGRQGA